MLDRVEGMPSPRDDEGWREIHHYAYVARPFDDTWPLLATQPNNVLGDGRAVPRGCGTSELHAHLGGVDVARSVAMHFSELFCDDERAGLAVHCRAARHPRMFPLLEATIELAPLHSGRRHLTQVGLIGRYRPPLGVLGGVVDRLGGNGIAGESIGHFVDGVARRLETMVTPRSPKPDEDEPTPDGRREPEGPELKKILLIVERLASRPGGAVRVARRLAATPGVVRVDIDPETTLAEIHYDPARCHPRDFLDRVDTSEKEKLMADIVGERITTGDVIVDYEDKVFPDHQAEPGQKAFVFYHCVPFESSASLVNLLTATRILRKGFETHFVMFGPGSLAAAATRGFPKVGDEAFPGNMNYNNLLRRFMDEGGHAYACRFSAAALYGMREIDMMEGVRPINPKDVLDATITAWKEHALVLNTWTM